METWSTLPPTAGSRETLAGSGRQRIIRIVALLLLTACGVAVHLQDAAASGIGAELSAGSGRLKKTSNSLYGGSDVTARLSESRLGIGLVYDTNVSEQQLFNYRLGISYQRMKAGKDNENVDLHGISFDNDFGFRLFSDNVLRLWAGPELKVEYLEGKSVSAAYSTHTSGLAVGVAPVIGANFHLNNELSLTLKGGYMFLEGAKVFTEWQERYGFFSLGLLYRLESVRPSSSAPKP